MIEPLFFDTDGISAFLWVGRQNLVANMYPGRIVFPQQVYDELSHPGVEHLRRKVDLLIENKQAIIMQIDVLSDTYDLYNKLVCAPPPGHCFIGEGEAACIALAKSNNGIVASNNLKDIRKYVEELNIKHITTGDILVEAYDKKLITRADAEKIWNYMLDKNRKIGANTFIEFWTAKKKKTIK